MIRVLDLFAGTQSVKKALDIKYKIQEGKLEDGVGCGYTEDNLYENYEPSIEYIGIDIYSPEDENTILNLGQRLILNHLIKTLPKNGKPDFIGASPICNKLSGAVTGPGGNAYFIVENNNLRLRKLEEYKVVKHNGINKRPQLGEKYISDAEIALQLHENTRNIIKYFNVPFAIENPGTSLAKYIYKDFQRSKANYCAYGFEYKKATAFYTYEPLNLKLHNKEDGHRCLRFDRINKTINGPSHGNKGYSTYANRSSVPPKLVNEIFSQLDDKHKA